MQFGKHKLTLCRYGWMLHAGPYIGKCFELYGQYSESEVAVLRAFLKAGDTAIDVGANIGDLTVPMSRLVGPGGRIYAIESHSDTYHVLCANLALNGIRNTKALNCFIADSPDVSTGGPWGEFGYVSPIWGTTVVPIDSLGAESCALIKIDVDGKELEVLRSARNLIGKCRPILYFENDSQDGSAALLGHAMGEGYDLYWHPAPIFEPDNFFGNPINHWAPKNITSLMVLGIPAERRAQYSVPFKKVTDAGQWWDQVLPK
ncbi:MAG TPA: FkbM family methyltransferase [Acetobacteraceae bacterium]|nr:FkbM family methyltransferase [Acetobacteraceae bacterium]